MPWTEEDERNLEKLKASPEKCDAIIQGLTRKMFRENFGVNNLTFQPKNLMVEEEKKLNSKVEELQNQLSSVQYENVKLNSQITTLNKVINSNLSELENLRTTNKKLEEVNRTLENNNAHYWRNTILVSLGIAIFTYILGLFTGEDVKLLLELILKQLQFLHL